jgi:hypothetical protein
MTENTKLWDTLGHTDPKHTKPFTRGGGFKGTAIKPIWSYLRMTEQFGPCGTGWGTNPPDFTVQDCGEERLVFCTASIWYGQRDQICWGVGGDKVVGKNKYGLATDDEAFKKAYTDAITNALKMIGVGADVHMGMFDDNKYVNTMREEFSETEPRSLSAAVNPSAPPPQDETYAQPPRKANGLPQVGWREDGSRTSFWLKQNGTAEELKRQLWEDAVDCHSLKQLEALKEFYRGKARELRFNKPFLAVLSEEFSAIERGIMNSMEAAELAEVPLETALKQSVLNAG